MDLTPWWMHEHIHMNPEQRDRLEGAFVAVLFDSYTDAELATITFPSEET
jgi:hypothetical protein